MQTAVPEGHQVGYSGPKQSQYKSIDVTVVGEGERTTISIKGGQGLEGSLFLDEDIKVNDQDLGGKKSHHCSTKS